MNTCKKTSTKVSRYMTFVDVFFIVLFVKYACGTLRKLLRFHLALALLNAFVMIGFL